MSSSALVLVNGLPRMTTITASLPAIYNQSVEIVASGGNGSTTLNGPITAGTPITLPSSGDYTMSSGVASIMIFLNGSKLEPVYDWSTSGSGPNYTAFILTFDLIVGDRLDIRAERG